MTSPPRIVKCPQCGAPVTWTAESKWRPFCSERCKMLDFGAWASERYRVENVRNAGVRPTRSRPRRRRVVSGRGRPRVTTHRDAVRAVRNGDVEIGLLQSAERENRYACFRRPQRQSRSSRAASHPGWVGVAEHRTQHRKIDAERRCPHHLRMRMTRCADDEVGRTRCGNLQRVRRPVDAGAAEPARVVLRAIQQHLRAMPGGERDHARESSASRDARSGSRTWISRTPAASARCSRSTNTASPRSLAQVMA